MMYIVVLIVSILGTIMIKNLAIHDHPNARSSHVLATPTGGGLAIVVAFYLGLLWFYVNDDIEPRLFYALLCGILLAGVSFVDDMVELSATLRLGVQLVSLAGAFYFLDIWDSVAWFEALFLTVSALWLVNLYNFLDGIDGYAGSEGIVVSLGAYGVYHDSVFFMMAVAIGGFLLLNWQKASIFMGDVGSTFLGFVFAVMVLYHYHDSRDIMIWWILLGLFIFDATLTLLRRMLRREKLSQAHKKHIFQRLVQSGFSHQKTVLWAMGFNVIAFVGLYQCLSHDCLVYYVCIYTLVLLVLTYVIEQRRSFDV